MSEAIQLAQVQAPEPDTPRRKSFVREVMFGGFTRRVLSHADLPVLMAH